MHKCTKLCIKFAYYKEGGLVLGMTKVFIDGSAGTTGLRIHERLADRSDIEIIKLPEELRKDAGARKDAINKSDIVFLCLPDAAAIESASLCENDKTVIIDTSTAHRTNPAWAYGFPEIDGGYEKIKASKRIANPGCHASGFIALVNPLINAGVIDKKSALSCFSITGYSGGGKKMIEEYQSENRDILLSAPRQYGLTQSHKHLKEMVHMTHLETSPVFCPVVCDFYSGMQVTVSLFKDDIKADICDIEKIYAEYFAKGLVNFEKDFHKDGFVSAASLSGRDDMIVSVFGNDERIILTSVYDNLGKGASGSAIQNMNIVLGVKEDTGLCIG